MFHLYLQTAVLLLLSSASLSIGRPLWAQEIKPVVVAIVIEADVRAGQRVVGTVKPLRTSRIGSALDGRVLEFLVDEGQMIRKGQTLAQLATRTLEIEQAAATAEHQLALSRLAELENGSRPEDIAEADAIMQAAKATAKNADSQLERMESLARGSASSLGELDDAKERADAAMFSLKATQALLKRIKEGPRKEAIAQAEAQVELQKQKLELINDRLMKSTITAPFDGFVSAEFTEKGAWINRGDPIVEIIQMDEVEILAPVTVETVVGLRKGDAIRVEFPEIPNQILTARVDRIVPVAAAQARTYPVYLRLKNKFKNETPMLLAGMLARVDVPVGQRMKLPLVPKDALVLNGKDRSVFVVDIDKKDSSIKSATGSVRKVAVELGVASDDRIQVIGEIKAGDFVVVEGNERLVPNSQVKIVVGKKSEK
jgi:RND family efflux transporter MFP subunit